MVITVTARHEKRVFVLTFEKEESGFIRLDADLL
jgi:hypothetical protein